MLLFKFIIVIDTMLEYIIYFIISDTHCHFISRNSAPTGGVTQEQRNLDTAATEFQRRFHISADDAESRQRTSGISINQVRLKKIRRYVLVF